MPTPTPPPPPTPSINLDAAYEALTGCPISDATRILHTNLCHGFTPTQIPTVNFTATCAAWILALAQNQVANPDVRLLPLRLLWVTGGRTFADLPSRVSRQFQAALDTAPQLQAVRAALRALSADPDAPTLAVSALSGRQAGCRVGIAQPAILIETADTVGRRVLFTDPTRSYRMRPIDAAIYGLDAWAVIADAPQHPAFHTLLTTISARQRADGDARPLRVTALGQHAHTLQGAVCGPDVGGIGAYLKSQKAKASGLAYAVCLSSEARVHQFSADLLKKGIQVSVLTAGMRAHEREIQWATDPVLVRFTDRTVTEENPEATGMVVLLTTLDEHAPITADVVLCDTAPLPTQERRRAYLAHPKNGLLVFGKPVPAPPEAELEPVTVEALDGLALTTPPHLPIPEENPGFPGVPDVTPWIHGIRQKAPVEPITVLYRDEVAHIEDADDARVEIAVLLAHVPITPHERIVGPSRTVLETLLTALPKHAKTRLWELTGGRIRTPTLAEFLRPYRGACARGAAPARAHEAKLGGSTLILPPGLGLLDDQGYFAEAEPVSKRVYDVSMAWMDMEGEPLRARTRGEDGPEGMRRAYQLHFDSPDGGPPITFVYWVRPDAAEDDGSRFAQNEQILTWHLGRTAHHAGVLADKLHLGADERDAVVFAAGTHDLGKNRFCWQQSINNHDSTKVLAKTNKRRSFMGRYRHEFGSLFDMVRPDTMSDAVWDLTCHLVAAHHGRARPHFPPEEIFDPAQSAAACQTMAMEVTLRFSRLQSRYGRWGLAHLESIVRAADVLASRERPPSEKVDKPKAVKATKVKP